MPSPAQRADVYTLYPEEAWHEDEGCVLWHHIGEYGDICEPPIVAQGGEELDDLQPWDGYYDHWSRLPMMAPYPLRSLMIGPPNYFICDDRYTEFETA